MLATPDNKLWADDKTTEELYEICSKRENLCTCVDIYGGEKKLCMKVQASEKELCEEHEQIVKNFVTRMHRYLPEMLEEIPKLLRSRPDTPYGKDRYFTVPDSDRIFKVNSENQLLLLYFEEYIETDSVLAPEEFYDQFPYDLATASSNHEYTTFEIPTGTNMEIVLSHIKRNLGYSFEEIFIEDRTVH